MKEKNTSSAFKRVLVNCSSQVRFYLFSRNVLLVLGYLMKSRAEPFYYTILAPRIDTQNNFHSSFVPYSK